MFNAREKIEIIVMILIILFGTPVAIQLGITSAKMDAQILFPEVLEPKPIEEW